MTSTLLTVADVSKVFTGRRKSAFSKPTEIHALNRVSLDIDKGTTLGVVGESGCGKSTLGRVVVGAHEATSGSVHLKLDSISNPITPLTMRKNRDLRQQLQLVFQDPHSSFNPRMTVEESISEPLVCLTTLPSRQRSKRVLDLLDMVGIPKSAVNRYPSAFSGGQRQRLSIARALATEPALIVADEPVSALDVSVQAQIVNLFLQLQKDIGLSYLFISHDLGVVRHVSDRIVVMYLGRIVETADASELFDRPTHPYTRLLIDSLPGSRDGARPAGHMTRSEVPDASVRQQGCPFRPRCAFAQEVCARKNPQLTPRPQGLTGEVACHSPLPTTRTEGTE